MIEEKINELITQMENHGYEFESDGPDTVGFWGPADEVENRHYKTFKDWDEVEEFVKKTPETTKNTMSTTIKITPEKAIDILKKVQQDNPQYFQSIVDELEVRDIQKRTLVQMHINLQEDIDKATEEIRKLDTEIKSLNGKRGWLIRRKSDLQAALKNVHLEWISKFPNEAFA